MLSKRTKPYDPDSLDRATRLRRNLGDLVSRNELPCNRVSSVVNDFNACAPTVLSDLASRKPDKKGKHQARFLKGKFLKKSHWVPDYIADIRCWDPAKQEVRKEKDHLQIPHEVISVLLKNGIRSKLLDRSNMDPLSLAHLLDVELKTQLKELLGIGVWGDEAPTQWDRNESISVISMSLPGSKQMRNMRIPLVILPHSRICKDTWDDVWRVLVWSLRHCILGTWPTRRHDNTPWNDTDKCRKTPMKMLQAVLVESRQDWKFASEVFGCPAHNAGDGICWKCMCTVEEVTRVP